MANKKKIVTSAVAVTTAATLLLGGTFAWQSISQTALNETEATINPGGRLHDDFDGTNKDVYVENFADEEIFARVRLDEYFEIVYNKGMEGVESTEVVTKHVLEDGTEEAAEKEDVNTYVTHIFGADNATDDYWEWTTGGSTVYMPTYNMNKDSLVADINGTMDYVDDEDANDPYGDYVAYADGDTKTATEIYDGDTNTVDEVGTDFDNLDKYADNIVTVEDVEHTATATGTAKLISMEDWLALESDYDNYWVYDTDGWVYYSSPIAAGKATGLLLDEISLVNTMDDSYYYAINVVGQFITADDLGKDDNTGFYADSETVSDNALTLLHKIGVKTDNSDEAVVLAAGLYDENGTLLATWENAGIDLSANADNYGSDYDTNTATAYYVLTNTYPTATKIILPEDVTEIPNYAFYECSSITDIDIKNVETIGTYAFMRCNSLVTVTGDSISSIGENCFNDCQSLTTINISRVTALYQYTFYSNYALTTLDTSNLKEINYYDFYATQIEIFDLSNVEKIGDQALSCVNAEKIILDKVTSIGSYAFGWSYDIKEIEYQGVSYTDVDTLKAAFEANGVECNYYAFNDFSFAASEE